MRPPRCARSSTPLPSPDHERLFPMTIYQILSHTPIWVWALLAFLVSRGAQRDAAQNNRAEPRADHPCWSFSSGGSSGLISSRGLGLALRAVRRRRARLGLAAGSALAALMPAPRLDQDSRRPRHAGFADPAGDDPRRFRHQICRLGRAGEARATRRRRLRSPAHGAVGGVFAGAFWGRTLALFRRALLGAGLSADWPAVARLVFTPTAARADRPAQ